MSYEDPLNLEPEALVEEARDIWKKVIRSVADRYRLSAEAYIDRLQFDPVVDSSATEPLPDVTIPSL